MRVYVATRFGLWQDAHDANVALREAGHEPTSQWVAIAAELKGHCDAVPVGDPRRLANAKMDLGDLNRSDALIVLVPPDGGTGMWVELGYAIGLNAWSDFTPLRIVLVGGPMALDRCVFCELVDDVVHTVGEAIALLSAEAIEATP